MKEIYKYLEEVGGFIDKEMTLIHQQMDNAILDEMGKASITIGIEVDKDRLKKWLLFCHSLDELDESVVKDIAIRKKLKEQESHIKNLERENKIFESALMRACDVLRELNYKYYGRDDVVFESSFIDEVRGENYD